MNIPTRRARWREQPSLLTPATRRVRERGAEALSLAILAPAALILAAGILQAALYFITSITASSAAQSGVQAARAEYGSVDAGISAASSTIDAIGIAQNPSVTGSRSATDATITVTAVSPVLLPVISLPDIIATAHGPVERVTQP